MFPFTRFARALMAVGMVAIIGTPLRASLITGNEAQLQTWAGQGGLSFTNLFSKTAGDGQTAADFHAAVDGMGATFMVLEVYGTGLSYQSNLPRQIIGGYNPQSWTYNGQWNETPLDSQRTAFLFNLTYGIIQRQNLSGEGDPLYGKYQTYSSPNFVLFGAGADLDTSRFMNNTGTEGATANLSYGGQSRVSPITVGGADAFAANDSFQISRMEIYSAAPSAQGVPDCGNTAFLVTVSATALLYLRRRRS
jgi:hypothetical protein